MWTPIHEYSRKAILLTFSQVVLPVSLTLISTCATTVPLSHSTPIKGRQPAIARTSVNVKVSWPSKTLEKTLHPELESLGKMLVRGTFKQIANAAWNSKEIRKHLTVNVLKQIDKECSSLCSRKDPSCLRSPSKHKMLDFSFDKENEELQERAHCFIQCWWQVVATGRKQTKAPGFQQLEWLHQYCSETGHHI